MNINKIHSNKQPTTTPLDDQQNGRKSLSFYGTRSELSWPRHKKDKKFWKSSLEDFEKKTICGL